MRLRVRSLPRRLAGSVAVAASALTLMGCATAPLRLVEADDFVQPTPDEGVFRLAEVRELATGWRDVQGGDIRAAEKRFRRLQTLRPKAAAPQTGLGYALLRAGQIEQAESAFLAVIARHPRYVPALAGAGAVFRRRGDAETAVELLRRAVEAGGASTPAVVRRRLGEAKLDVAESMGAAARRALAEGRADDAIELYRRAVRTVPELAGLRLELADLLNKRGDPHAAIEVLSADALEDRQVLLLLGSLSLSVGQPADALRAAERVLLRDPRDDDARRLATKAQGEIELSGMPEEYRRIFSATRITRADLAALLAVRVPRLATLPLGEPPVATDISGAWARQQVMQALGLGAMEVFPNHTFQPAAIVRRGDLAQTLSRILDLVGAAPRPAPTLNDVPRASLHYDAAARAVAHGLMDVTPAGTFEPWRPVTGPEAVAILDALSRQIRAAPPGKAPAGR